MSTAVVTPTLVAAYTNDDGLGFCANVLKDPNTNEFEVAVVDATTGGIVVTRTFDTQEKAEQIAQWIARA